MSQRKHNGGPFAEDLAEQKAATARSRAALTTDVRRPLPPPARTPGPSLREAVGQTPLLYLGLFVVLLLGFAFWIGRATTGGETRAAGTQGGTPGAPTRPPLGEIQPPRKNNADAALYAKTNQVTLRVAAYVHTPTGIEIAYRAYDYLIERGFPVATPMETQDNIFLFVGAAPRIDVLQPLLESIHALPDPAQPDVRPFADAYILNIDDVIVR